MGACAHSSLGPRRPTGPAAPHARCAPSFLVDVLANALLELRKSSFGPMVRTRAWSRASRILTPGRAGLARPVPVDALERGAGHRFEPAVPQARSRRGGFRCAAHAPRRAAARAFTRAAGIPEIRTILSGTALTRYLSARVGAVKFFSIVLALGSGISIGKEVRAAPEAARGGAQSSHLRPTPAGPLCAHGRHASPPAHRAAALPVHPRAARHVPADARGGCGLLAGWLLGAGATCDPPAPLLAAVAAGVTAVIGAPIGGVLFRRVPPLPPLVARRFSRASPRPPLRPSLRPAQHRGHGHALPREQPVARLRLRRLLRLLLRGAAVHAGARERARPGRHTAHRSPRAPSRSPGVPGE